MQITVAHGDRRETIEVDPESGVEVLRMQIASILDLDFDKMVIKGAPFQQSILHDTTDLTAVGLKEGFILTVSEGPEPTKPPIHAPAPSTAGGITLASLSAALDAAKKPAAQVQGEPGMREMQARLASGARHVLTYEDQSLQAQALRTIPVEEIRRLAAEEPGALGPRDAVARQLLSWFKHRFFKWVNNEACASCGSASTRGTGGARPNAQEAAHGAGVVELYQCNECSATTRFPRYNNPGKLLETRKGRCGEW
jgi:hypothetical protein